MPQLSKMTLNLELSSLRWYSQQKVLIKSYDTQSWHVCIAREKCTLSPSYCTAFKWQWLGV